jgi:hypothetical protein
MNRTVRRLDLFPQAFDAAVLEEWPGGVVEVRAWPEDQAPSDGLLIRFQPHGGVTWLGLFRFWDPVNSMSAIVSLPRPDQVCVIAGGRALVLDVNEKRELYVLPILPVTDVRQTLREGINIVAGLTSVAAIGANGVLWHTRRITWDDLQIDGIEDGRVFGTGLDPTMAQRVGFSIDLATGDAIGGSFIHGYKA